MTSATVDPKTNTRLNEERKLLREIGTNALAQSSTAAAISMAEIDKQITTAHAFPRSITKFREEALELVTMTHAIADECIYALPRDGKTIEGPSARFAEVIASCWGNSRAGARVMGEEGNFIISQGAFHDLERNVAITYEVKRRISDKNGRRYSDDMIATTSNAACSIALRNAVLKGVPKAFWSDIYEAARNTVAGSVDTLEKRRNEALSFFTKKGVTEAMICQALGIKGTADIGLDQIVVLRGIASAVKNGEYNIEEAFSSQGVAQTENETHSNPEELVIRNSIVKLGAQLGMNPAQITMAVGQHADDLVGLEKELQRRLDEQKPEAEPQQQQSQPASESPRKEQANGKKKTFNF